jgi:phosphoribosylamine---glycine ligase
VRVLVIGGGGREHALCDALRRDPKVGELVATPGNPGIASIAETIPASTPLEAAERTAPDLIVVGPEAPLVDGEADRLREAGYAVFGPSAAAARLEGSKAFAKDVMAAAGVPTAGHRVCASTAELAAALDRFGPPYVVKHDALAAGKGVVVTSDRSVALAHGEGRHVVVEEFLDGPEVSLFCLVDGAAAVPLVAAQDFKRIGDGDTGPNTGGMGAYAPLPWAPAGLADDVLDRVVRPTVAELARRGTPFSGLLYVGLALAADGPKVVEFNVRFGDPESQVVLPLLDSPLGEVLLATATGHLGDLGPLRWRDAAAVTVVVASARYPDAPRTGDVVNGVDEAARVPGVTVFHAGTALDAQGRLVTAGGRVLSVTAVAADLAAARRAAYLAVDRVHLDGGQHRSDIALAASGMRQQVAG